MSEIITTSQCYKDDIVVIKVLEFLPYSVTEFFITCKIKINRSEWFEYKAEFRDKGYEPFDDFDPVERQRLFEFIERSANGNKYRVAYNLIDEPLSDLVLQWENAHDGVG